MSTRINVAIHDHQLKSVAIQLGLIATNCQIVMANPDIFLTDHDATPYYRQAIDRHGVPTIIYPHGARAWNALDGCYEPHPMVVTRLVWGIGAKEVLEGFYDGKVEAIGWTLGDRMPFVATSGEHILFCPIHPGNRGEIDPQLTGRNQAVYSHLLSLDNALRVRHIGSLEANGLFPAYEVEYTQANSANKAADFWWADLVVGRGTIAYEAIALGIPTVMIDEDLGYRDMGVASNWESYQDLMRYPYNFLDMKDCTLACTSDLEIREWRNRFIGEVFDPTRIHAIIQEVLGA